MWTIKTLREEFVNFFKEKNHFHLASAKLPVANDPTLMFVNSGMAPLKDYFIGTATPPSQRVVTCQKVLRVSGKHNDFEEVGASRRHQTFFEMLGNFSFGDYFKKEAIIFALEFIQKNLKLPNDFLWVTINEKDEEAYKLWSEEVGFPIDRIVKLGDNTNKWSMGNVGPWGYCSEIFFYTGNKEYQQKAIDIENDHPDYLEIWNLVFMQYYRDEKGEDSVLPFPCIDTGMGLERTVVALNKLNNNYDISFFKNLIKEIEIVANSKYSSSFDKEEEAFKVDMAIRVIADHIRSACFLIADGIFPGNEKEAYVLRRICRRAIRFAEKIGIKDLILKKLAQNIINEYADTYPELVINQKVILECLEREELQFRKTLNNGLALIKDSLKKNKSSNIFSGEEAFKLYDTYGFPLDLTKIVLAEESMEVDEEGFNQAMLRQKELSKQNSEFSTGILINNEKDKTFISTKFYGYDTLLLEKTLIEDFYFTEDNKLAIVTSDSVFYGEKGGQIGDTGLLKVGDKVEIEVSNVKYREDGTLIHYCDFNNINKNELNEILKEDKFCSMKVDEDRRQNISIHHSATHLLDYALREVLGKHVQQKGSLVEDTRLRFDFSHHKALSREEIIEIEKIVNNYVLKNYSCEIEYTSYQEALNRGALAFFADKYGDEVRLVKIGEDSLELCGGTHIKNTGEIGLICVLGEASIASGIRRIQAVAGNESLKYLHNLQNNLDNIAKRIKSNPDKITERLENWENELKNIKQYNKKLIDKSISLYIKELINLQKDNLNNYKFFIDYQNFTDNTEELNVLADTLLAELKQKSFDNVQALFIADTNNQIVGRSVNQDFSLLEVNKNIIDKFKIKGGGNKQRVTLSAGEEKITKEVLEYLQNLV